MSVQITDRARRRLAELGLDGDRFLRVAVVPGGCSGNTYSAGIDDTLAGSDQVVHREGELRVVSDRASVAYLDGLEIDYSDDLVHSGFRFKNPRAARSCGCGASFAVLSPLGTG